MAKKLSMLLVVAGLLVVGLVGFLYFSPSGMTIEKFQNAPAEPAFVPPVLEKPQRAPPLTPTERAAEAAAYAAAQEKRAAAEEKLAAAARAAGPQVGALSPSTPLPPLAPQAGPSAIQSMMPPPPPPPPPVLEEPAPPPPPFSQQSPPPTDAPTPIAPTPASSEAALRLTPVQCSALCPVTQETCESMFSCRTRLEPIGVTPMSMTSTPAAVV